MSAAIFVVGPTGSGKSALGLALARRFSGAILNCDSLQVYKRLDIGTAKPSRQERAIVPHFLFDVLEPGQVLTAGDYRRMALDVLNQESRRGPVFIVGGSGFYVQALEKGMFEVPKPSAESERQVRDEYQVKGLNAMYEKLQHLDPETAEDVSPNDSYRILRALIVYTDSGKTLSSLRKSFKPKPFPYPLLKLGLSPSREELELRIRKRTKEMLASGLLGEVDALLRAGFADWPALQSVGYKECLQVCRGQLAEAKLADQINEKTMQLAKKQKTWFKRDTEIHWLPPSEPLAPATEIVARFLDSDS